MSRRKGNKKRQQGKKLGRLLQQIHRKEVKRSDAEMTSDGGYLVPEHLVPVLNRMYWDHQRGVGRRATSEVTMPEQHNEHVRLYRFILLAAQTGRIYVAEDVWEWLEGVPSFHRYSQQRGILHGMEIIYNPLLPSREMLAINPEFCNVSWDHPLPIRDPEPFTQREAWGMFNLLENRR